MQQLMPAPEANSSGTLDTLEALAAAYPYPSRPRGPYLRANMVASLDGAASHEGTSGPLSSPGDKKIFGVLRALADAVLVGAETARREGYRPAKARKDFQEQRAADGQSPAPAIAVLSRRLDLDFSAPLFTGASTPTIVLTGSAADPERRAAAEKAGAVVVTAGEGESVDPARAVRELAALGHTRLLHEGGPRVLAQFAAAGVLDELCLTLAPVLTGGSAPRIMNGPEVPGPARYVPAGLLTEDGFLFARYVRG
ncbi:pyrimidine reductase family protein [Actinacidiphila guanduensis]|uniref:5-amino-6-(5-phosphoribosylamino)uracil reductase n=1 Tax=Actinacidiphila guanduensis TaxID=310781 RepID=A0A1H0KEQ0_9ACTN|nr:pyrimidine reductase family protein [Actinacidiphila guanduensis]SDO54407.1 5-amino-6-(5-phosphoribosylamino)uracil reductase [Actinacidiphila guanduensis]